MTPPTHPGIDLQSAFPLLGSAGRIDPSRLMSEILEAPDREFVEQSVAGALVEVGLDTGATVVALAPGLLALLSAPLPLADFGVRAANLLYRQGFRSWRDLGGSRPSDLMMTENFGATSLSAVMEACVRECFGLFSGHGLDDSGGADLGVHEFWNAADDHLVEDPDLLARIAEQVLYLGDLMPGLRRRTDDLPVGLLPPRLQHRLGMTTWSELAEVKITDLLALPQIGIRTVGTLLTRLRRETHPMAGVSADAPTLEGARTALAEVAEWAVQDRGATVLGDLVALREEQQPLPRRLHELWSSAMSVPLPEPSDETRVGALVDNLLAELDERQRAILTRRVWRYASKATLEEIGELLNVTRERVRQLEGSVISEVRALLDTNSTTVIEDRATELRRLIGSALPIDSKSFKDLSRWSVRDVSAGNAEAGRLMLMWLAGPYQESQGWLRLKDGSPDPKGADLRERCDDGGFMPDELVAHVLTELQVRPEVQENWIEAVGGFRRVPGGWLDSSGSILDQAIRFLAFRGVPMTTDEILEGIGRTDASARSIRQRLFEDPRAVRVSKGDIGLRAWGHDEYTSLADEMLDELEKAGGSMPLDLMVERLVDQFGVSPNSIRMYAGRPLFLVDGSGRIQVRPDDQPYEVHDDLLRVPFCYELSPTTAAWRVPVDRDILRGSGRHIAEQLAGWLRLRPGNTASLSNPIRPIAVAWRAWAQPDIGSLKPFAEELGCRLGDWLVLVFDRGGTAEVRSVARTGDGEATLATLGALVGLDPALVEEEHLLVAIGHALGVDTTDGDALRFRIRAALVSRRDTDIVDLADEVLLG